MIENPEVVIELNSHTDFRGDDIANMEAFLRREAMNVLII